MRPNIALLIGSFCALGATAQATDLWVDPVSGNDANAGTSLAPLRSITQALVILGPTPGAVPDSVLLEPGFHDPLAGNTFPILLRDGVQVVGVAGPSLTEIRPWTGTAVVIDTDRTGPVHTGTGVRGVTLRGGDHGIAVRRPGVENLEAEFEDIVILDALNSGVNLSGGSTFPPVEVDFTRVDTIGCGTGYSFRAGSFAWLIVRITDSVISNCHADGVAAGGRSIGGMDLYMERCALVDNARHGVRIEYFPGNVGGALTDSVVARNGGDGVHFHFGVWDVHRSTIVDNAGIGYRVDAYGIFELTSSIIFGNGDDIDFQDVLPLEIESCCIGDGDYAGVNGTLAGDPRLRDLAAGDYRLRLDSPCVDSAATAALGALDFTGRARSVDGDFDLVYSPDIGAFELATLDGPSTVSPSSSITLEVQGPAGQGTLLFVSRSGLNPSGTTTPFGLSFLPSDAVRLSPIATTGDAPSLAVFNFVAPPGTTLGFQGLTRSAVSPTSGAWGNAHAVEITN